MNSSSSTLYSPLDWPLGRLWMTSDGETLTGLYFTDGREQIDPSAWTRDDRAGIFARVREQLREYWEGGRREFDLPLKPAGTPFQQRVWQRISDVPFGGTISYRDLAERAGSPASSRAAGLATGRNPISIIIPCHRIVGSNGSLTGYGGGLDRKRALLDFEATVAAGERTVLQRQSLFAET
jgi:methylated-DNA-[protein]-cysteine S-methyltransferase